MMHARCIAYLPQGYACKKRRRGFVNEELWLLIFECGFFLLDAAPCAMAE